MVTEDAESKEGEEEDEHEAEEDGEDDDDDEEEGGVDPDDEHDEGDEGEEDEDKDVDEAEHDNRADEEAEDVEEGGIKQLSYSDTESEYQSATFGPVPVYSYACKRGYRARRAGA